MHWGDVMVSIEGEQTLLQQQQINMLHWLKLQKRQTSNWRTDNVSEWQNACKDVFLPRLSMDALDAYSQSFYEFLVVATANIFC